ncbi:hypothetical protein DPMN_134329 [Dreissena polymorpha]|uniref:Uncharacterized protein n=1 Tax=Dreissena polymorpha TaxID=45954 RepID=A0A9D4FVD8_DREPO|nr:hypothetical protein DPMN_134329 [Dreissena polymorpha]
MLARWTQEDTFILVVNRVPLLQHTLMKIKRAVPKYRNETSSTTAIVARKDTHEEGLYEFQFSTQFPSEPENNDIMYLKYTMKDLVPVIEDGNGRVNLVKTVYKEWNVTLDARRSVDPAVKLSAIGSLSSGWLWTSINAPAASFADEMVADHVPKGNIRKFDIHANIN